jgi:hypothetical protein
MAQALMLLLPGLLLLLPLLLLVLLSCRDTPLAVTAVLARASTKDALGDYYRDRHRGCPPRLDHANTNLSSCATPAASRCA